MKSKYSIILCELSYIIILASVYLPWVLLKVVRITVPYIRGVFCDDDSIKYPYHESTIPAVLVYATGLVVNIALIGLSEMLNKDCRNKTHRLDVTLLKIYRHVIVFLFGYGVLLSTLNILKYSVGRLRPHFLSICSKPSDLVDDSCKVEGRYIYSTVLDRYCSYGTISYKEADSRLSFPSGHAAMAFFFAIYFSILLQRLKFKVCPILLRPFLQYVALMFALYIACSRVSDMKHHVGDVVFGSFLGVFISFIVGIYTKKRQEVKVIPRSPSLELSRSEYSIHSQYG